LAALAVVMTLAVGCGPAGKPAPAEESLTGTDLDQANRLFSQLTGAAARQADRQVLDLTASLLDYYPNYPRNDEALALAVTAAARVNDTERALGFADAMLVRHPGSPRLGAVLETGADLALTAGDTLRAAGYLVAEHDRNPVPSLTSDGRPRRHAVFAALDADGLGALITGHPDSALRPYLSYLQVAALLEQGDAPAAETVAADLSLRHPGDVWTLAASDLVAGGTGWRGQRAEVDTGLVGILCPLSGRFAVLGNAFYDAALLAAEAVNQGAERRFTLVAEDSAGDAVRAALATRRLANEHGVVAIVGALTSGPTATAAVVADVHGVPLVSPTATNDNIWELGPGVFQSNLTGIYEIRMMAQLATTVLLKSRFAILYPDGEEGRRYAEIFRTEIENLGGEVVAEEAFAAQGTDFKDPILTIRARRPEVVFVPGSVDQMILLGPQLDFYRLGALVMGLSNWNSPKLAERSATVLERALFPNDLILFPAAWTADFEASWNPESYPREATALALKTYQATRMLLDTMNRGQTLGRRELTVALQKRLANRDVAVEGPESYGRAVRMFRSQTIVEFPAAVYTESWALTEGVAADSLTTESELPAIPVSGRSGRE
jgi:branched-chain amino acid transport system substrate-binding protein